MRNYFMAFWTCLMLPLYLNAQEQTYLKLPNQDLLSSNKVMFMMEDKEGFLWYATEGGGVCRDDGRQVDVFKSDAEHPDLLGSNNIDCLAEMGNYIIIGTFHGAYMLDKNDFTIKRLKKVDDKRVDDILVMRNGDVMLTANMKIYRFDSSMNLKTTYSSKGKYVARIFEDRKGNVWATLWGGGLLRLEKDKFVEAKWALDVFPNALVDDKDGFLWVGTMGQGVVKYNPEDGSIEMQKQINQEVCTDLILTESGDTLWVCTLNGLKAFKTGKELEPVTISEILIVNKITPERLSIDKHGRLLVAGRQGGSFAIGNDFRWKTPETLTNPFADSLRLARQLSERPTALAVSKDGTLWFSTGKDIRKKETAAKEEVVILPDTKDVAAMAFSKDGSLWLGTIFGQIYRYKDGVLTNDDYASNEFGDAVNAMSTDSLDRLILVYDRYARIYDINRHTLRQQSIEEDGTYCIEMQESKPYEKWSQPQRNAIVEKVPSWLTSWWMWCIYAFIGISIVTLIIYNYVLRKQRDKFLQMMKEDTKENTNETKEKKEDKPQLINPLLEKAIAQVENNLSNDKYNVEELSKDLCMSRMTLYRKIQTLTGQKPTEFIRTIRLRKAAEMLHEGQMTVTEVSYATGFSSVSYFSRCFRTMYGVPPTQFN